MVQKNASFAELSALLMIVPHKSERYSIAWCMYLLPGSQGNGRSRGIISPTFGTTNNSPAPTWGAYQPVNGISGRSLYTLRSLVGSFTYHSLFRYWDHLGRARIFIEFIVFYRLCAQYTDMIFGERALLRRALVPIDLAWFHKGCGPIHW